MVLIYGGRNNSRISPPCWCQTLSHTSLLKRRECFSGKIQQRNQSTLTCSDIWEFISEYKKSLPFVQRILNSNHSDRLKISASQMLFNNMLNLDKGIFIPKSERSSASKPLSQYMSMLPNSIWDADTFNLSLWLELRILMVVIFCNQLKIDSQMSEHVSVDWFLCCIFPL